MKSLFKKSLITASVAVALSASTAAYATNGYFSHGYGTTQKGLAGAGAAYGEDSLIVATNPAGLVNVGDRLDIGAALFMPKRGYESVFAGAGVDESVDSDSNEFLIPHFGYSKSIDSNSSWGIAAYGNGGMNTDYENSGLYGAFVLSPGIDVGIDLKQLFIAPTYAAKFNGGKASWGVSALLGYQTFQGTNVSSSNDEDTSTGIGFRVGVMGEVSPGVTVGASYQPRVDMSEFSKYDDLFAEDGDFDIPSNFTIGVAADAGPGKVVADIQVINYSEVDSVANDATDSETGFAWNDMTVYKIGYQLPQGDITYRFGYSFTEQPIPDDYNVISNVLAPAVVEQHLTAGLTVALDTSSAINAALMIAPSNSVKGSTTTLTGGANDETELTMDQLEIEVSYTKKF